MKKSTLLNSDLSYLVATLGHTDQVTICDAGLPIPDGVQRIDLALTHGVPSFLETVKVMLSETHIDSVIIAEEFALVSPALHDALLAELNAGEKVDVTYLPHEALKVQTHRCKAVVRTGECTPFANVIFSAGVGF
ncbi:D-ribose pyranase [Vibrio ostreicida]|uniref:D-ribose pyranase n=1 Tax=Vibrio ostreicida TaxID=526588 RepID=A0ABT8C1J0_9VIBR|nr:D-ribose pyranase [Vibrio ostreicida]MDN3612486.1 D-ribose pyranase [Vibrio ostreicida]NPD10193.1 D-ribose pyranase [Vibrio ostreicida]